MWVLIGSSLLTGLMVYVHRAELSIVIQKHAETGGDLTGAGVDISNHLPWSEILSVWVQSSLIILELYSIRQISSRLVSINMLMKGADQNGSIEWLRTLEVMDEASVQYHFQQVAAMAGKAKSREHGSSTAAGEGALISSLEFAKVGKLGYNKETFEQLRGQNDRSILPSWLTTSIYRATIGSTWALNVPFKVYALPADRNSMKMYGNIYWTSFLVSLILLGAGVTNASGMINLARNITGMS